MFTMRSQRGLLLGSLVFLCSPSLASAQLQVEWAESVGTIHDDVSIWVGPDGSGDLHMVGFRETAGGVPVDVIALAFDRTGALLYKRSLVPASGTATIGGSKPDASGAITGSGELSDGDSLVMQVSGNGQPDWASRWSSGSAQEHIEATAVDEVNSRVFSAGETRLIGGPPEDALVVVHDRTGALLGAYAFDTLAQSSINSIAIHHEAGGNVSLYLAGNHDYPNDAFVMKLDVSTPVPDVLWARGWSANGTRHDAYELAVDPNNGDVYVAGSTDAPQVDDLFVLKLDGDGNSQWAAVWGTTGSDEPGVQFLSGRLFVTGTTEAPGLVLGTDDALLMELDPASGAYLWAQVWGGCMSDIFALTEYGGEIYAAGYTTSYEGSLSPCDCQSFHSLTDSAVQPISVARVDVATTTSGSVSFTSNTPAISPGNLGDVLVMKLVDQAPWSSFCSSGPNSTCSDATMRATGSASLAANDLELHADVVPDKPGLFFYSAGQVNGGAGIPFGNGLRCVGGGGIQVSRLPIVTGQQHTLSFAVDNTTSPANSTFVPGQTLHFQAWYRDPTTPLGFDLSNGLSIPLVP